MVARAPACHGPMISGRRDLWRVVLALSGRRRYRGLVTTNRNGGTAVQDPEVVWRLGLRLYDAGMEAIQGERGAGAARYGAARLRALAGANPAVAVELRDLAEALDAELRADAWNSLAEAEELVGSLLAHPAGEGSAEADRREEAALDRLAALRRTDPEYDRPLAVLAEWVRVRRRP